MMSIEINSSMDRTGSKKAPRNGKNPAIVRDEKEFERIKPIKELLIEPL
jgi:hypothetical protein